MHISEKELDELLDLVSTAATPDQTESSGQDCANLLSADFADADASIRDTVSSIFRENHAAWVNHLKVETDGSWSEDQYDRAGHLINMAEYKRLVLSGFVKELASHAQASEDDNSARAGTHWSDSLYFRSGSAATSQDSWDFTELASAAGGIGQKLESDDRKAIQVAGVLPATADHRLDRANLIALLGVSTVFHSSDAGAEAHKHDADAAPSADEHVAVAKQDDLASAVPNTQALARPPAELHVDSDPNFGHASAVRLPDFMGQASADRLPAPSSHDLDLHHHEGPHHAATVMEGRQNALYAPDQIVIDGSDRHDVLAGTGGRDVLHGFAGNDLISSGAGDDQLFGGANDDVLDGGRGADLLDGGDGNDTATYAHSSEAVTVDIGARTPQVSRGEASGDVLVSIENLTGSAFDDSLTGNAEANVLDGGKGADAMAGGEGDDIYIIDNVHDIVFENESAGTDLIATTVNFYNLPDNVENLTYTGGGSVTADGNALDNIIVGGSLSDILSGLAGNDTLIGGEGDDALHGGEGDDRLDGGAGHNVVDGGQGNDWIIVLHGSDTILLRPGFGNDVIDGFETLGHDGFDLIDVSAFGLSDASLGTDILVLTLNDDTVVSIGSDTLTLLHTKADAIDKGEFIYA